MVLLVSGCVQGVVTLIVDTCSRTNSVYCSLFSLYGLVDFYRVVGVINGTSSLSNENLENSSSTSDSQFPHLILNSSLTWREFQKNWAFTNWPLSRERERRYPV